MARLTEHHWPGNIRELKNMIERLVIMSQSGTIEISDLPEHFPSRSVTPEQTVAPFIVFSDHGVDMPQEMQQFEHRLIDGALHQAHGIKSKAAQLLHLNRSTLAQKIKRKAFVLKGHS
jgi:DNA-binding NtrC family response regulator